MVKKLEQPDAELAALTVRFHYLLTQASGNSIYSMTFRAFEPAICALTEKRFSIERQDLPELIERMKQLINCICEKKSAEAAATVQDMLCHGIGFLEARYE